MSDASLCDWDDIKETFDQGTLLLGNGASLAVSSRFGYKSLFAQASLTPADRELFKASDTHNFEEVLRGLDFAGLVYDRLGENKQPVVALHERIRSALVEAVHAVHVKWSDVGSERFEVLNNIFCGYKAVFSTNYDLLLYWSLNHDSKRFVDFFWGAGQGFNRLDIEINPSKIPVYWLHGGLHLFRGNDGVTTKKVSSGDTNILTSFLGDGQYPLYVAEGTSQQKLRSIGGSDYLSFCLSRLAEDRRPLTIFGHSLGDSDQHLVQAINQYDRTRGGSPRKVAISVFPQDGLTVDVQVAGLKKRFGRDDITFFDSRTHPLGDPVLWVC